MSADLALELEDVVFRYQEKGRRNILDHTSLTIPAGTLTVLMGGSGCGKSTLAAVAAGLYPENGGFLESGIIRLYGQDLKTLDPQKRAPERGGKRAPRARAGRGPAGTGGVRAHGRRVHRSGSFLGGSAG